MTTAGGKTRGGGTSIATIPPCARGCPHDYKRKGVRAKKKKKKKRRRIRPEWRDRWCCDGHEKKKVSSLFALNDGEDLGVAYEGIPTDTPLVSCVVLGHKGDSVEFFYLQRVRARIKLIQGNLTFIMKQIKLITK